jgi:hypothetical protein
VWYESPAAHSPAAQESGTQSRSTRVACSSCRPFSYLEHALPSSCTSTKAVPPLEPANSPSSQECTCPPHSSSRPFSRAINSSPEIRGKLMQCLDTVMAPQHQRWPWERSCSSDSGVRPGPRSPVLTLGLHHRFSEKGSEVRFRRRSYRAQQGPCAATDLALTKKHGHRLWRRHSSFGGNNG